MTGAAIAAVRVVAAPPPAPGALTLALAPLSIASGLRSAAGLSVEGGRIVGTLGELETGQQAALIAPDGDGPLALTWRYGPAPDAPRYPEAAWRPRRSRWTLAADDLAGASRAIADAAGGGAAGTAALIAEARPLHRRPPADALQRRLRRGAVPRLRRRSRFLRGRQHLSQRLPARGGLRGGLSLRLLLPCRKGGPLRRRPRVATRHDDETLDWDVAHHIKAGLDPVRPALNPRGGRRVAVSHSMGWRFVVEDREIALKLLGEPVWLMPDGAIADPDQQEIRAL